MRVLVVESVEGVLLHHVDNARIEVGLLSWNARQPDCTSHISSPWHVELSQGSGHEVFCLVVGLIGQVISVFVLLSLTPVLPARVFRHLLFSAGRVWSNAGRVCCDSGRVDFSAGRV